MSTLEQLNQSLHKFGELRLAESMRNHTTFGIGGPADMFLTIHNSNDLEQAIKIITEANTELFILGSGSNIIVGDKGIRGVVIDNRARKLEKIDAVRFKIDSGANFSGVARKMCRSGLAGLAWAVGIPGTFGGAVIYNAGAYGGCLNDVLIRANLFSPQTGSTWLGASELNLTYRNSILQNNLFKKQIVLKVEIILQQGDEGKLSIEVANYDKRRLATQPRERNPGSMFRNTPNQPAWKLVEAVGMRGMEKGQAKISERHANFFINTKQASAKDVLWLVKETEKRVYENFGIKLIREVNFVGAF